MKLFLIFIGFIVSSFISFGQLPPIIDRELFFGDPDISGAQISPDGKFISFLKPFNGVRNIWVKGIGESFDKARPVTDDTLRPISQYFWSRNGKYILYSQDKGGDENFRIYAVNPSDEGTPVPPSRDLTPLPKVRAFIYDVPKKTPSEIIIGLNDRRPDLHDVYRLNIETGERTLMRKNDDNVVGWDIDHDGNIRLAERQTSDGGTEILLVNGDSLTSIFTASPEEDVSTINFTPDNKQIYISTNKGDVDKDQLELLDLATGQTTFVEKDPLDEVDFGYAIFSDKTEKLLATAYVGDRTRLYFKDKQFESDYNAMVKTLPPGEVTIGNMTADENIWMVVVSSDVDPGSRYIYNRLTGKSELVYKSRPNLPSDELAAMEPVSYTARDSMTIHAYLTLPKGIAPEPLPVVMFIHGGPWARDVWGYNPYAQFFANRGYAVFQPNFRGSTGYGKKFLNAGNKQWGTGSMQHDITDGVEYLIKKGIADPKRVGICGGSYGGYATLAGLAFTPDLYAAGFDIVGPSNIITLLNSIPPYWAPLKKIFDVRVGNKDDANEKKMLEEQSPLFSADKITAPLYVVQGANDPRVKKTESDQIVAALRDLGRPVQYMLAPDEGHGYAGRENRLAMTVAMEDFFAKYLGGRAQKDVPADIQEKLDAITVNVDSVKAEAPTSATGGPMPMFNPSLLKKGMASYNVMINSQGQEIAMSMDQSIDTAIYNGVSVIRVIGKTESPMGSGDDTLDFDAATLLPIRRTGAQGQIAMSFAFTSDSVTGSIEMAGNSMPINVKTDGPSLPGDASGGMLPLLTLPLKDGYSATINMFDMMQRQAKPYEFKVLGTEKLTTAQGSVDAFKVELKPQEEDGSHTTFWISVADRTLLRVEASMAGQMAGSTMVMELK
jgi:dipeptidyl aminopeptidase/acylaminoacyl peptidase